MLKIEDEEAVEASEMSSRRILESEGVLFVSLLAGSWVIAIGAGWIIWRLSPL